MTRKRLFESQLTLRWTTFNERVHDSTPIVGLRDGRTEMSFKKRRNVIWLTDGSAALAYLFNEIRIKYLTGTEGFLFVFTVVSQKETMHYLLQGEKSCQTIMKPKKAAATVVHQLMLQRK